MYKYKYLKFNITVSQSGSRLKPSVNKKQLGSFSEKKNASTQIFWWFFKKKKTSPGSPKLRLTKASWLRRHKKKFAKRKWFALWRVFFLGIVGEVEWKVKEKQSDMLIWHTNNVYINILPIYTIYIVHIYCMCKYKYDSELVNYSWEV